MVKNKSRVIRDLGILYYLEIAYLSCLGGEQLAAFTGIMGTRIAMNVSGRYDGLLMRCSGFFCETGGAGEG